MFAERVVPRRSVSRHCRRHCPTDCGGMVGGEQECWSHPYVPSRLVYLFLLLLFFFIVRTGYIWLISFNLFAKDISSFIDFIFCFTNILFTVHLFSRAGGYQPTEKGALKITRKAIPSMKSKDTTDRGNANTNNNTTTVAKESSADTSKALQTAQDAISKVEEVRQ